MYLKWFTIIFKKFGMSRKVEKSKYRKVQKKRDDKLSPPPVFARKRILIQE